MEHAKVFEVAVGSTTYYVSASAKHKLLADLHNLQVSYRRVSATKRKYHKTGTTIFFDGTLESPITPVQLVYAITLKPYGHHDLTEL